ncbi:MAG TPA: GNAT family N-acetyltransferase, partial [Thermoplasmata archaeon]|nr:GNAT family N-acetyltransferase [Thermoplasmata archaeon]
MPPSPPPELGDQAAAVERAFVLALGGFALDVAGASCVTHERIPVPRFNYVLVTGVSPERQAAFFERALDHYFQRALRPTFRIPLPVPSHLDAGLRKFAFRRRAVDSVVRWTSPLPSGPGPADEFLREASPDDLDKVVALWTDPREREEFRRALEVVWNRPNPGERVRAILAEKDGTVLASGVVYERGPVAGLFGVATVPGARGKGVASRLVTHALGLLEGTGVRAVVLAADAVPERDRLGTLGFTPLRTFAEYALPPDAELTLP